MAKDHGPQIKDDARYEALRDKGMSKEKAARISNAQANPDIRARRAASSRRTKSGPRISSIGAPRRSASR
jgi:hypothetical protein